MNLSTNYMGLELKNPLVVSSSKLTSTLEGVKDCAYNGAGAVVLKSLFEEQIHADAGKLMDQEKMYFWYPEAVDYVNEYAKEGGVQEYLELIRDCKKAVEIPVIASINCITSKDWPAFSKKIEEAGADGIELNVLIPPFNPQLSSTEIEKIYFDIVSEVRKHVEIPVSVKLGSYFTNLSQIITRLAEAGASAQVLFNRYYQPDIDINKMKVVPNIYSEAGEITHSLRWLALFANKTNCDFSASTGIHDGESVIKTILAGADAAQVCTALYKNGIEYLKTMIADIEKWMEEQKIINLMEMKGIITKDKENEIGFDRVQFMGKTLGSL